VEGVKTTGGTGNSFAMAAAATGTAGGGDGCFEIYGVAGDRGVWVFRLQREKGIG
jgi:hypothetical protein